MRLLLQLLETEEEGGVVGHSSSGTRGGRLGLGRLLCLCGLRCGCGCGHDEGRAVVHGRQVGEVERGVGVVPQGRLVVRPRC